MDIAVAVMAFKRERYLRQCIERLEDSKRKDEVDWYLYQGAAVHESTGERYAEDEEIEACLSILENANLPNKTIIKNESNIGIAKTRDKIFDLFDEYDAVMIIEEDSLISTNFINIFEGILNSYPESTVSLHRVMEGVDIEPTKRNLSSLIVRNWNAMFGYGMREETFRKIEDGWRDYIELLGDYDHRNMDISPLEERFPKANVYSDDGVLHLLSRSNNIPCVCPLISRLKYIGMEGLHYSLESYKEHGMGKTTTLDYEEDESLMDWRIREMRLRWS